tara:strand:- start:7103 stop:7612 length:510 start_codon:yes stop_codon:yes gene_type:complete
MPNLDIQQLSAPVPGQSLTAEPKSRPWETPPKYETEEEALGFYVNQMNAVDRLQKLVHIMKSGFPVADLVDAVTLSGVMQGLHTIDVAVLIAPTLFELFNSIADIAGIEVKDGVIKEQGFPSHIIQLAQSKPQEEELIESIDEEQLQNIKQSVEGLMTRPEINMEEMEQ